MSFKPNAIHGLDTSLDSWLPLEQLIPARHKQFSCCKGSMCCLLGTSVQDRDMPHLASRSCRVLSIEMEIGQGASQNMIEPRRAVSPDIAEQVDHGRRLNDGRIAEGQIANGSNLLFKLARASTLNRQVP